jgi:Outer membrane protein beta-barrel domain
MLLAFTTIDVSAQVQIGPKIGINSASADIELRFGESFRPSPRKGLIFGAVINTNLWGPFSLQLEPQYVRKGYRLDDTSSGEPLTVIANLDYVELPVVLHGAIEFDKVRAFAFAGPNIGFRMAAKVSSVLPNSVETNHVEYSTKDFDLSLDVGAGVAFQLSPTTSIFTDARVSRGLINIDRMGDSYHSRDLKVSVGLLFSME